MLITSLMALLIPRMELSHKIECLKKPQINYYFHDTENET